MKVKKKCPACGRDYYDPPALSRKDDQTEICPNCGVLEALAAAYGFKNGKQALPKGQYLQTGRDSK